MGAGGGFYFSTKPGDSRLIDTDLAGSRGLFLILLNQEIAGL